MLGPWAPERHSSCYWSIRKFLVGPKIFRRSDLIVLDDQAGAVPYLPLNELGQNRNRTQGGNQ